MLPEYTAGGRRKDGRGGAIGANAKSSWLDSTDPYENIYYGERLAGLLARGMRVGVLA